MFVLLPWPLAAVIPVLVVQAEVFSATSYDTSKRLSPCAGFSVHIPMAWTP